jgi:tetratricopeptide (TPR) repeat protein
MYGRVWGAILLIALSCWQAKAQEAALLKDGDSVFAKGDYDAARRSFEKALQTAPQPPADSASRYDILKRLTSASAAAGQFADAQRYLEQAIKLRESADDLVLSVNLAMRTKDLDHALATAQRAQAMHVEKYTAESLPAADDLVRIGEVYLAQGRPAQAMKPLLDAYRIRTRLSGSLDAGLLPVLDRIDEANAKIAGPGGAFAGHTNEAFYRQALAIRETLYGEDSPELISTVEGLANLYSAESNLIAAEPLYLRLLALWESAAGKDHPMVAVTLDKLVVFYTKYGEPEKARAAMARSVAIRAHFLAVGLSLQAQDAISENHREQARALYNRALAALGPASPANEEMIAEIRKALGSLRSSPVK